MKKYRKLLKKTKEARVGQIISSGILPVFGTRSQGYRNSRRMAVNGMVKELCREEEVGFVDLWDSFVGKEEMYLRDGLLLRSCSHHSFGTRTVPERNRAPVFTPVPLGLVVPERADHLAL